MTQADVWDLEKIRKRLICLLDQADQEAHSLPYDHSGNIVPVSVATLFLLERSVKDKIYGTIEIPLRGSQIVSPKVTNLTARLGESYAEFLH